MTAARVTVTCYVCVSKLHPLILEGNAWSHYVACRLWPPQYCSVPETFQPFLTISLEGTILSTRIAAQYFNFHPPTRCCSGLAEVGTLTCADPCWRSRQSDPTEGAPTFWGASRRTPHLGSTTPPVGHTCLPVCCSVWPCAPDIPARARAARADDRASHLAQCWSRSRVPRSRHTACSVPSACWRLVPAYDRGVSRFNPGYQYLQSSGPTRKQNVSRAAGP